MKLSLMTFMSEIPLHMDGAWSEEKSAAIGQLLRDAAEAGFTGVDLMAATIRRMGSEWIRQLLGENHLALNSLICFDRLADTTISDEEAEAPYLEAIDTAAAFSCEHLMLTPGMADPDADTQTIVQTLKRRFGHIAAKSLEQGVTCMIEDDPNLRMGMCRLEDVQFILREVPQLKLVYDSANMIVAGEDPVTYYEAVKDYVIHTHIKDIRECREDFVYYDRGIDGRCYANTSHGTGIMDFERLFRSFAENGYDGILSLEYVPSEELSQPEDLRRIFRYFSALACQCCLGANEVGLISKLVSQPYEEVWKTIREIGVRSVELCVIPDYSDRLRVYNEEISKRYGGSMPDCFAHGIRICEMVDNVRNSGLEVYSCHVFLCDAYPAMIEDSVPFLREVHARTGISQFVMSCSFESASTVEAFIPYIQSAAEKLRQNGITLCYHNHHQDSMPLENGKTALEMILEGCPDCMIQLDIGWAWYGRMDSVAFLKQHGERVASVHLKDLTADSRERTDAGRFTAAGSGAAPTGEVLQLLKLCAIAPGRLIFDQDATDGDMYDDLRSGIRYVREHMAVDGLDA